MLKRQIILLSLTILLNFSVNAEDIPSKMASYPRFTGIDKTVLDQLTGMVWQRCSYGQTWQLQLGCVGVAKKIWFDEAKQLQDSEWRLPSLDELKSLYNTIEMKIADDQAFPDNPSTWYWALDAHYQPKVWGVSCEEYEDSCFRGGAHAVRLVKRKTSDLKMPR